MYKLNCAQEIHAYTHIVIYVYHINRGLYMYFRFTSFLFIKWHILLKSFSGKESRLLISYPWWRHQMETFSALPVKSAHKGQWRGALMFSLIHAWTNGWVNNRDAGDLARHRANYDVSVMRSKTDHELIVSEIGLRTTAAKIFLFASFSLLKYCFIFTNYHWALYFHRRSLDSFHWSSFF